MNKKHIKIVAVIIILTLVIGGGLWWCLKIPGFISPIVSHDYYYKIRFATDIDLYNVTLYIPVSMLNEEVFPIITENDYKVVDTEHGKMIKITRDTVNSGVYGGIETKLGMKANHEINTKNPKGNEPLLCPRFNETFREGGSEPEESHNYYDYQSYIYLTYNASYNASIYLNIWLRGANMHGAMMTWEGNAYSDEVIFELDSKNGNGWYMVNGTLSVWR